MTIPAPPAADLIVPGPHGAVPLRLYAPAIPARDMLVWIHGGGFVGGDLDMPESDAVGHALAAAGVFVVAVGYRLAGPGSYYPVPSDDVLAAWRWSRSQADTVGVDPHRVHLGGASAGGNLAAGAVLRLIEQDEPVPATLFLAYPTLHAVPPQHSPAAAAALMAIPEPGRWSALVVDAMYRDYIGKDPAQGPPAAVPGSADPAGFPPTFVLTSEIDGLRCSGDAFVDRLSQCGIPVLAVCEPGVGHGHLNQPATKQFARSLRRLLRWLDVADDLADQSAQG